MRLERIVASGEGFERRLLAGRRAAPPEDSGGVFGCERLAEPARTGTLPDSDEDGLEELREWIEDWHPDAFDLGEERAAFDR